MRANSKHYVLLIVGIITLGVCAFGYWSVYRTVVAQAENYSMLEQDLKNGEETNKQEIKLIETSSSTLDKRTKLFSYFVSEDKILDFIKSIENIGPNSSVDLGLSSISTDSDKGMASSTVGRVKLHVNIKGSWVGVNKALALIENLPYSISISSVSFNSSGESSAADKKQTINRVWNLTFDINALTMK